MGDVPNDMDKVLFINSVTERIALDSVFFFDSILWLVFVIRISVAQVKNTLRVRDGIKFSKLKKECEKRKDEERRDLHVFK